MDDLGSGTIQCNVNAQEVNIPVIITGGTTLSLDDSGTTCPQRPAPDPNWLVQLTGLSQVSSALYV